MVKRISNTGTKRPRPAEATPAGDLTAQEWEMIEVAGKLAGWVVSKSNDRTPKKAAAACAAYYVHAAREWETPEEFAKAARLAKAVIEGWKTIPRDDRRRMAGGWELAEEVPTSKALLKTLGTYLEGVDSYLVLECATDELIIPLHEFGLTHGNSALVRIMVRSGTPKCRAVDLIHRTVAAMEKCWDRTIAESPKV